MRNTNGCTWTIFREKKFVSLVGRNQYYSCATICISYSSEEFCCHRIIPYEVIKDDGYYDRILWLHLWLLYIFTSLEVHYFFMQVTKAWSNLKELDISFNKINDTGSASVATILRSCPDLLKLNIEHCFLSQNASHQRSTLIEAIKGRSYYRFEPLINFFGNNHLHLQNFYHT